MPSQIYPVKQEDIFEQTEIDEGYNKEVFNLAYAEVKEVHIDDLNTSDKILDVDKLIQKILKERNYQCSEQLINVLSQQIKHENLIGFLQAKQKCSLKPLTFTDDFFISRVTKNYIHSNPQQLPAVYLQYFKCKSNEHIMKTPNKITPSPLRNYFRFSQIYLEGQNDLVQLLFDCYNLLLHNTHCDMIEQKFTQKVQNINRLKTLKIMNYQIYYNIITDYYTENLKHQIEVLNTDTFSILERFHIIHLKVIPFYFQLTVLNTYLTFLEAHKRQKLKINLPNIQKIMLCLKRVLQLKFSQIFHCDQLLNMFNQHVKNVVLSQSNVQNITLTMYKNQIETPNIQQQFQIINDTIINRMQYISKMLEVVYVSIGDEYQLDDKHIVIQKVSKALHMSNFYVSNTVDEQEESEDDDAFFELGQKKEQKPQLKATSFYQLNRIYDDAKSKAKVFYEGLNLMNTDTYKIDDAKIELMEIDQQIFEFINRLNKKLSENDFENILGQLMTADKAVIRLNQIVEDMKSISQFTSISSLNCLSLNMLDDIATQLHNIKLDDLYEQVQILERNITIVRSLNNAVEFKIITLQLDGVKKEITENYENNTFTFHNYVTTLSMALAEVLRSQTLNFIKETLIDLKNPEYFGFIIHLRKQFNKQVINQRVYKLIDSYLTLLLKVSEHVFLDTDKSSVLIDAAIDILCYMELFYKYCSEDIMTEQINVYTDMIKTFDTWLYEHVYELSQRIQEFLNIKEYHFNLTKEETLEFMQIYKLSCINIEIRPLNVEEKYLYSQHAMNFIQLLQQYLKLEIKCKIFLKGGTKINYIQTDSDINKVLNINQSLFIREKVTFKHNSIDLRKVVGELLFVAQQYYIIFCQINKWRQDIYSINYDETMHINNQPVYPGPNYLVNLIYPVYIVLNNYEQLDKIYEAALDSKFNEIDVRLMELIANRLIFGFQEFKKHCQVPCKVFNNKYDYIINRQEQEEYLAFQFEYTNWEWKYNEYIDKFKIMLHDIAIMYMGNKIYNLAPIKPFCEYFVKILIELNECPQLYDITVKQFFEQKDKLVAFDKFLFVGRLYIMNISAIMIIQQLKAGLDTFTIIDQFNQQVKLNLSEQNKYKYNVFQLICSAPNVQDYVHNALHQLSLIVNNQGFVDKIQLNYQSQYENVLKFVEIAQIPIKQQEIFNSRFNYIPPVQQMLRDFEVQLNNTLLVYTTIKRIPYLMQELLTICHDGNLIYCAQNSVNDCQEFQVNILSEKEKNQVYDINNAWLSLVQYTFQVGEKLSNVAMKPKILQELINICVDADVLHSKVHLNKQSNIIQQLTSYYNKVKNIVESTFELKIQYETSTPGVMSSTQKVLIPYYNGRCCPQAVQFPSIFTLFFGQYIRDKNLINNISTFRREGLFNIDQIITNYKLVKGLQSGKEKLMYNIPIQLPKYNYIVIDQLLGITQNAICMQASLAYRALIEIYNGILSDDQNLEELGKKYMSDFTYHIIFIGISTIFYNKYQQIIKEKRQNDKAVFDLSKEIKLIQLLQKYINYQEHEYQYKAYLNRLMENKYVFEQIQEQFNTKTYVEIVTSEIQYPFIYYDDKQKKVFSTNNLREFVLQTGPHWMGQPTIIEKDLQFNKHLISQVVQGIWAITENLTLVVVGNKEQELSNPLIEQYMMQLSRYVCRKYVIIPISEITFATNMQQIISFLISGYLVMLIGVEYIPNNQVLEIVNLSNNLYNKKGQLPGVVMCNPKQKSQDDDEQNGQLDYVQSILTLNNADVQHFDDIGSLILYFPCLENVEQVAKFYYENDKELQEEDDDHVKSLSKFNMHSSMQINEHSNILINKFENYQMIMLWNKHPAQYFLDIDQMYGEIFYQIHCYMVQYNTNWPHIDSKTIRLYSELVKDKKNPMDVSVVTMIFLLQQYYQILYKDDIFGSAEHLSMIVGTCFGLEQYKCSILKDIAIGFLYIKCEQLIQLKYKTKSDFNLQPSEKSNKADLVRIKTFDQYLNEVSNYLSDRYMKSLYTYSKLYNIPLQMVSDILKIRLLLRLGQPILISSMQSSYNKQLTSILASINKQKLFYVVNDIQLCQQLKHIEDLGHPDSLIVITIYKMQMLQQMMDQVLGMFLQQKKIRNNLNLTHYIYHNNIHIIILMDFNLVKELALTKYNQLFTNKLIMISPSFCENNKKLFIRSIQVNPGNFILFFKLSGILFKRQPIQGMINEITSYNHILDEKLSIAHQRMYCLQYLTQAIISKGIVLIFQIFQVKNKIEDYLLLRSIFLNFLRRLQVVNISTHKMDGSFGVQQAQKYGKLTKKQKIKQQNEQNNYSLGYDSMNRTKIMIYQILENMKANSTEKDYETKENIEKRAQQYYKDSLTLNMSYIVDEIFPTPAIGGYYYKDLQQIQQKIEEAQIQARENKKQLDINTTIAQSKAFQQINDVGLGFCGSLFYDMDFQYIFRELILPETHVEAFSNLTKTMFITLLNSAALYSAIILKMDTNNLMYCYEQFFESFQNDYILFSDEELELFKPAALLLAKDKEFSNIDYSVIQHMNANSCIDLEELNIQISKQQLKQLTKTLFSHVKKLLPTPDDVLIDNQDNIQYLHYCSDKKKYVLLNYECEQGIFDDISLLTDKQQLEKCKQMKAEGKEYKPRISLQNFTQTPIFLDSKRLATAFVISCAMQAPVTASVVGIRALGKSTLIDIAKLLSLDAVSHNNIILSNLDSKYSSTAVLNQIATSFQLKNYKQSQITKNKQQHIAHTQDNDDIILDYNLTNQFPCYHFHLSELQPNQYVDNKFKLLFNDHMIFVNNMDPENDIMFGQSPVNKILGCVNLSDCSFIIECSKRSQVISCCQLIIEAPILSERFLTNYFWSLYPNQSYEWNNKFIKGYFMLKSSIPPQLANNFTVLAKLYENKIYLVNTEIVKQNEKTIENLNNYNKRRYEGEVSCSDLLSSNSDSKLLEANVHSLNNALRSIGGVSNNRLHEIADRIASLSVLGYLQDDVPNLPWSDVKLFLTGKFTLYSLWEAQIINFALNEKKPQISVNSELINKMIREISILVPDKSKLLINEDIDEKYQYVLQNVFVNPFWFGHIIEIAKQIEGIYDPIVLCRSFELFLRLVVNQKRQANQLRSLENLKTSLAEIDNYNSIYSLDPYKQSKEDLIDIFQTLEQNKQLSVEYEEDNIVESENPFQGAIEQDPSSIAAHGASDHHAEIISALNSKVSINKTLTSFMNLSFRVQKYYLTLINTQQNAYQMLVDNVERFSPFKTIKDGAELPSQLIFDVDFLLKTIDVDKTDPSIDMEKLPFLDQLRRFNRLISGKDYLSKDGIFIILLTLLRVAIGIAVGIDPLVWLEVPKPSNASDSIAKLLGVILTSKIHSRLPACAIENGMKLSQMPLDQRPIDKVMERQKQPFAPATSSPYSQQFEQFITDTREIIIVTSKSIVDIETPSGVQVLTLLANALNNMNVLETLFSPVEMQFILHVLSSKFGVNQQLSIKHLSLLLSSSISLVVISDDPCGGVLGQNDEGKESQNLGPGGGFDIQKLTPVNSIKSPILSFISNVLDDREIIKQDKYRQKLHKIKAFDLEQLNMPLKIVDPLIQRLIKQMELGSHNLVNVERRHMLQLYKISHCYLPAPVDLPDKVRIDKAQLDQEFSLAVVQVYNYLAERAKGPCVSLTQFSKTAMLLTSSILDRCQIFFQAINNIFVAYRLYASLLGGKGDEQQVIYDLSEFDFDELQRIIRASQEQVVDGAKQFIADARTQAIAEAKAIRDLLYSVILCLQPEFQQYKYISQIAHLDSVCLAGFLYFCTTGLITDSQAYKFLIQEFTNTMEDWFSAQLEQCTKVDSGISAFNLLLTAILGQCGFTVRVLDPKVDQENDQESFIHSHQQKAQKIQFKPGILGQNALQTGEMLFLSNFMDAGGFDWPVFALQTAMNIPWQLYDASTICLNSVATMAQIGFKTFITKGDRAIPAACLIEAIKADKQSAKQYYKISSKLLQIGNIKKQVLKENNDIKSFNETRTASEFNQRTGSSMDFWKGTSQPTFPESQRFTRGQTRDKTRDASSRTSGNIGGSEDPGQQAAKQFTNDMLKRLSIIDLSQSPAQFDVTLQKALTYGDHTLLFTGYGRQTDNTITNSTTLQKFLRLRSSGTVKRKTVVQIRSVSVIINNDLENYNIVIGMDTGKNIIIELQKAGLLTQEFIDQCAICDDYGNVEHHDKTEDQAIQQYEEANEIAQIQFQLLQGCYGPKASARGLIETIRLSVKAVASMVSRTSNTVLNFVRQQIMRVKKDIAQHELTPGKILTIIQDYVKFSQNANRIQNNINTQTGAIQQNLNQISANNPQVAIFQMSIFKENNDKLFEDLKDMLSTIKSLDQSLIVKKHTRYNISGFKEKGQALLIESQEQRIIRSDSLKSCRYVAIRIAQIQKDIKKMSISHLPVEYIASVNHYKQIQSFIAEKVVDMRHQLRVDDAKQLIKNMEEQNQEQIYHLDDESKNQIKEIKFNLNHQLPTLADREVDDKNSISIDEYNDQVLIGPIRQKQFSEENQMLEKASDFYIKEAEQDVYYHRYCYPISFLIRTDESRFIKFLAKSYIQHFNETAIKLMPTQMQWPFYNYIHTIFLSLLGITHFSYDVKSAQNNDSSDISQRIDEIMLLRQALCINHSDYVKLITTSQLTNALYKQSSFNLENFNISNKSISSILQILPDQCKLSIQILILWLNISFASKYNLIIKDSLLWLLQHTSCMIAFSKVKNPLASMLEYWYNTQSVSRDKYAVLLEKTLKIIPQDYFEFKISQLPPAFEDISEKSLFSALIMTILMYPDQFDFTFRIYSLIIADTIGDDYRTIKEHNKVSLHRNIPCIITSQSHVQLDGKVIKEQMIQQLFEPFKLMFRLCGIEDATKDKITDIFISKQLYQIYSFLSNLYTVAENKVGIIFYDQSIGIQDLVIFAHSLIFDREEMHIQQKPCHDNFINNYNMYILLPDNDGCQIIDQIYTILDAQLTSRQSNIYKPIIVCIPSSTTARHPNCTYFCSTSINNEEEVHLFLQKLHNLQSRVDMMHCYISQENNLFDNIRHNFCTTVQTVYLMAMQHIKTLRQAGDVEVTINNIKVITRHSIRGLLIMILRQSVKQLRPAGDISDHTIVHIVRRAFQDSFIIYDRPQIDEALNVKETSFDELTTADLVFLQVPKQLSLGFEKILTNRINHEIIKLLFGQEAGIGCLFREKRAIVERKLVPLQIEEEDLIEQQEADEEDQPESTNAGSFSRTQSTFTDSEFSISRQNSQIMFANKKRRQKSNQVNNFINQGGVISTTAQHLLKKKGHPEEETNVYNQLEINLHSVGQKIQQIEQFDAEVFELSIKELLGENSLTLNDVDVNIHFKDRYISIDEVIELMWQLTKYNENYQRETELKDQFLDFLPPALYHRAFFASRSFIQSYIPMPLEQSLKTIPKSQRLYFKLIGQQPQYEYLLRRLGPQEVLDSLVLNTSFVPAHVSLNQFYMQLKSTVILSVPAFQSLLGNLLSHLKLYNAQATSTSINQQRLVITTVPPPAPITITPDGNLEPGIPNQYFKYYTLRGFQLINAYYDADLDTIADVTTESVSGYSCMMDLYVSIAVVSDEQDSRGIVIPKGYIPVPLQISGQIKPFVLIPNRSGLPDSEWTRRNVFFGIPQW